MSFIIIQNYNHINYPIEIIYLMFYLYGIDMIRVYFERLFRGLHPFTAENNHLHHYIFNYFKNTYISIIVYILLLYSPLVLNFYFENYLYLLISSLIIYLASFLFFKKVNKVLE
jgi:hypothetical protein